MTDPSRRLVRHLALAIGLKLVALVLLWQWFVHDQHVAVDSRRAAENILPVAAQPVQLTQEVSHDQ